MTALQRLIQADDTKHFFDSIYQQDWHVFRGKTSDDYLDLFSFEAVEQYLYTARTWEGNTAIDRKECLVARHPDGVKKPGNLARADDLMLEFAEGHTLILNLLDARVPVLSDFCASLGELLTAQIQVNAYCTPPKSQGFATHYDGHDVFVVQLEGQKSWRVWSEPDVVNPPSDNYYRDWGEIADPRDAKRPARGQAKGEPVDITLKAGDVLYIPRGFAHDAQASESASLHLTFGIIPTLWFEYLKGLIEDAAMRMPELRAAIPHSLATGMPTQDDHQLAHKLLDMVLNNAAHDEAWRNSHKRRVSSAPTGMLRSIIASSDFDENTRLALRSEAQQLVYSVTAQGKLWISAGGRRLKVPNKVAPYISWLCETRPQSFVVNELPDDLPGESRVAFAQFMVKHGLATVVG